MGTDGFKQAVSVGESESLLREEIEGKRRLYVALAESIARGQTRLIDAGHVAVHLRRPDAVLQAIQDLLAGDHGKPLNASRQRSATTQQCLDQVNCVRCVLLADRFLRDLPAM